MSAQEIPLDAPEPRLCHLVKWADFEGYGFNLHAEKSRSGQFIGNVDHDSPAHHAGLQKGDRIIEVNGVNIANENHRQVVERIKSIPDETKLLVVDEDADRWYKEKKIVVKSTQANVRYIKTPVPRPSAELEPPSYANISVPVNGSVSENGVNGTEKKSPSDSPKQDMKTNGNALNHYYEDAVDLPHEEAKSPVEPKPSPASSTKEAQNSPKPKEELNSRSSTPMDGGSAGSAPDSPRSLKSSRSGSLGGASSPEAGLNLNMSASEMRQMLASRKKKDPKKVPMDIRQKYEIIQQM